MLRVWADFNSRTPDGLLYALLHNDVNFDDQVDRLGVKKGDKIIVYQDEDDFEVVATLDFKYVDYLHRDAWVAMPDFSTLVRK